MLRTAILGCAILATSAAAFAQSTLEPDGKWRGSIGAGLTAASGNTDASTMSINADAGRQTATDKLSGYLQTVYGRQDTATGSARTSALARTGAAYNRDIDDRIFGFGSLDLEHDGLIDLELRSVAAGGLGYHLIRRQDLTFDVSTGPAYNHERYANNTREFVEWLIAEESTHALTPTVSFRQRLAYYPNLKEPGEFRTIFDAGVVIKVAKGWNATVTLNNRYQSNPLPGVKKNDLLLVTGLQYAFQP